MRGPSEDALESLVISSEESELTRLGAWVSDWSRRHDVPIETAARIDLCSTEVVTNIMTYAYADRATHSISLLLSGDPDKIALEIVDDGRAFDPRQLGEPEPAVSLEDAKVGGLGVHIARSLSDDLLYRRSQGRNHLTLIFRPRPE